MALIVQKYGGTSVGTPERLQAVAKKICHTRAQGHDVVVVVSAINGETDRLIRLAKTIQQNPTPREYAVLVATGEQVSIALLSMALQAQGCPARSYTGAQVQILTDCQHKKARILSINDQVLREDLAQGCVPVVAGFQGVTETGEITTLGRGGSDTTAVALAAALRADECQIYTDVDGVYTADPRIIADAHPLPHISFDEMLEFASLGAKVMQHRAVEFASKYQVPLRILSSFNGSTGTLVDATTQGLEQPLIRGITYDRQVAKFSIYNLHNPIEGMCELLGQLHHHHIETDMLVQQITKPDSMTLSFAIAREDSLKAWEILQKIGQQFQADNVHSDTAVAKLSVIGIGLRSHPAIISTLFKALGTQRIPVQLVATSEIKASALISEEQVESGLQALHSAFWPGQVKN